jgi:hypothetical protein
MRVMRDIATGPRPNIAGSLEADARAALEQHVEEGFIVILVNLLVAIDGRAHQFSFIEDHHELEVIAALVDPQRAETERAAALDVAVGQGITLITRQFFPEFFQLFGRALHQRVAVLMRENFSLSIWIFSKAVLIGMPGLSSAARSLRSSLLLKSSVFTCWSPTGMQALKKKVRIIVAIILILFKGMFAFKLTERVFMVCSHILPTNQK